MSYFDFSTFPVLETERLILRRIMPSDAPAWFTVLDNPEVRRYLMDIEEMEGDNPESEGIHEIIAWADEIFANKTGIRLAITLKPDDVMIGSCGFHLYDRHNQRLEIGYELGHEHWRKGIMSEAVSAVLDFCFNQLPVHRIEADVTVGNEGSAGLLKSLGFTLEGTWRDRGYAREQFYSLWQFGLLKDEYQADTV